MSMRWDAKINQVHIPALEEVTESQTSDSVSEEDQKAMDMALEAAILRKKLEAQRMAQSHG